MCCWCMSNVFTVEHLLEKRCSRRRVRGKTRYVDEYLVKWLGFSSEHNTWVPEKDIFDKRLIENMENDEWEVNQLLRKRIRKLKVEYLVEWADRPRSAATWEPEDNLPNALIKDWEDAAVHHTRPEDLECTEQSPPPSSSITAAATGSASLADATDGSLRRPRAAANARGVHWAADEELEHVKFVETEFGLPANANDRERRAYFAGIERAKLRLASKGGGVKRKPEGEGLLCKSDDARTLAETVAEEVARSIACADY